MNGQITGGMRAISYLSANTDLNSIYDMGTYYVQSNAIAQSLLNCPSSLAGVLKIKPSLDATQTSINMGNAWSYAIEKYEDYHCNAWVRPIIGGGSTGSIDYGAWKKIY